MRFIGDVHGKYRAYKRLLRGVVESIQVGDMGIGFRRYNGRMNHGSPAPNPPHYLMTQGNHRFIRGNHDNPNVCRRHSQYIPDGHSEGDMMFVGGAASVDRHLRHEGYDWWANEELSSSDLYPIVDRYNEVRPRVMITHDCPESVAEVMEAVSGRRKIDVSSVTRQALQVMLETHPPEIWIFGHRHQSFRQKIGRTHFICLAELEHIDL